MTKTRQWTIFTVLAVVVVLLAGWLLLVKPQSAKTTSLRSQAATQQSNNALLQTKLASLLTEKHQLVNQQAALAKFRTQVPQNASEPAIIRQLSAAAAGANVDLIGITPGIPSLVATPGTAVGSSSLPAAPSASGQLVQLPVSIGITGTYPNVESFFQEIEKLPRAMLVTGWSLCPDPNVAGAGAGVSCTLPPEPVGRTLPVNAIGGTLSAFVFYAPPTGVVVTPTVTSTTPATAPTPTGTPSATPTPTVASTAPAN
jgi:Tfp pilus assembly protein PilO